ncbi:GNAT family N-acetyltransferase [Bellilinea sp.]
MQLIQAKPEHLDEITELIHRVTAALVRQGIYQWDEYYPNRAFFHEAIMDGNLFIFVDDTKIIGCVVLDEWQPPEWAGINWQSSDSAVLVIHALAIESRLQRHGYGSVLLQACEHLAIENGYKSIRLDTLEGNSVARYLYERHGYRYRGQIRYCSKPVGHQTYLCYEKILT